ncbi:hypothetical protein C1645_834209 [Glomus cerebriforme]|uniref:Uncharacterized protein n=1 Tax=Glomus cerebriforme TaxID=658196 RepID=A0A397SEM3_9GLOM|nr:hypothetical protein C1645_834209 [Glomus cerebriforme]
MSVSKRKQSSASYPWSQKKISISNPFPRYGHSASQNATNNEFFLFGGIVRGKPRNEAFVVDVNTLNVLAFVTSGDIPSSRSGHTHVNIGKNVIVFGGLIDESTNNADENLYILDTVSKVWSKLSVQGALPLARHGHSVSVIGTKMYVFGGQHVGRYLNDLVVFDIKTRTSWDFIVPNNQPPPCRSGHVSFAYKEKIYIFGGIDENKCYNDVWCYDARANTWTELSCTGFIPHARYNHGSTIVDDVIYVFGGRTYDEQELGDLTAYRITNQRWYMFQKMGPAPSSRYRHTMTSAQNKIFVFGGESGNSPKPDEEGIIHILDTSKIKYPPLTAPPANPQQIYQGLPSNPKDNSNKSPINLPTPQSSIDSDETPRFITPSTRQSSIPKEEEQNFNSKSNIDVTPYGIRSVPQLQQTQNSPRSLGSLRTPPPENTEGGGGGIYPSVQQSQQQTPARPSPQPYNQGISPTQQGYLRGSNSPYRQTANGTPPPKGFSPFDMNAIVMSNSKGNPPEQITYIERSVSPHQRSVSPYQRSISPQLRPVSPQQRSISYGANSSIENLRKQTPSPFGNTIDGILLQSQRSNDSFRENNNLNSQQPRNVKKQSIFENPRQAPRPPNSSNSTSYGMTGVKGMSPTPLSPISINSNTMPPSPMPYEENDCPSSTVVNSPIELRTPTSDNVDHSPARIMNAECDERDEIIAALKKREMWFRAELALARKSGYILDNYTDGSLPDGVDLENLLDMGDTNSEKFKVMEIIVKLKQEIRKSKASIINQAQIASQKITDSERARTAALQEAVYLKAKLVAITNASESELASIEVERANDLEKRLTQALIEKEEIQNKFIQSQQNLDYEKTSRESAEERAKNSTIRAEEAEEAHARVLAELATLHSRATSAESQLRETKSKLAESIAELTQYRTEIDNIQPQISQSQQSIDQHKRALEQANNALTAANERTNELESLWKQARQDIVNLEKEAAGLRAELDVKMRDLDRSKARTNDMERLLEKAQKENEAMRAMMQEGMTKLLNNNSSNPNSPNFDTNDTLDANDKLKLKEQELSALKLINDEVQKTANEATTNLSGAMVKMLQLESSVMKARSESAVLQRRLAESNDEVIRTKGRLREKERILEEKSRALEDAEVKIGMMRDVMTERGIFEEGGNYTGTSMSSRFKEMESRCEELENIHVKTQAELKASIKKYKDALRKAEDAENKSKVLEEELERASNGGGSLSLTPDISNHQALEDELRISETKLNETQRRLNDTKQKLSKMELDYNTVTSYVKNTEKMLRRVKDELTKSNSENSKFKQQLSTLKKQNEGLEDEVAELKNQVSLQKGFRASRQDFANVKQLVTQREEFLKEKEEMKKKMSELVEHAREEKLMSNQSYEALRKEYDNISKEYKLLRQTTDSIQEQFAKAEKDIEDLQGELEETLSLNELLNQQLDEALKNNGNLKELNERRISTINRERWKEQREILEKQNKQLREENVELDRKLRDSESKISLLLDQMETAVDNYRGLEDEIRATSPRNSRIIDSLTNELDILKSQFETPNNDSDNMNDINSRITGDLARASSRLEEYDEIMATLDAVQKSAAERSKMNINAI